MYCSYSYINYSQTHSFSELATDYVSEPNLFKYFFAYTPDYSGIDQSINHRKNYPVNRQILHSVLTQQYQHLNTDEAVRRNIDLLLDSNTFTVCTAHQPNLMTGYLYFIYKIVHAIKLSNDLKIKYPKMNFVPVYYMGSEDNDLDELGTFRYEQTKYTWDANGQTGAVGRMKTESLKPILNNLFSLIGPPGDATEELKILLSEAYLHHKTVAEATLYLVDQLFNKYGLIVVNPDNSDLKRLFTPIILKELLEQPSEKIVQEQSEKLAELYKAQAFARPINLFYLNDNIRERITYENNKWHVLNTSISWGKDELQLEVDKHPERFSPNVITRGLFQETILPNIVFIGGGAEVAYWLQLKPLFECNNIFYPCILLRQSGLWINKQQAARLEQLPDTLKNLFLPNNDAIEAFVKEHNPTSLTAEQTAINISIEAIKNKATLTDATLEAAVASMHKKIDKLVVAMSKKIFRAEKRKHSVVLTRYEKLKSELFPLNSLQERHDNFISYYATYGTGFITHIYNATLPLGNEFMIIKCEESVN